MFGQQARQEARVQFRRVAFINCYLRRTNGVNETLDELVDLGLGVLVDESGEFWAQKLQQKQIRKSRKGSWAKQGR